MLHWLYVMLVNSIAILISAYILSGVQVKSFGRAFLAAIVLGIINAFIRPLFLLISLPITVLTFGLFVIVINAVMLMLASALVPGFEIKNFGWAVVFGIILSIVNSLLFWVF